MKEEKRSHQIDRLVLVNSGLSSPRQLRASTPAASHLEDAPLGRGVGDRDFALEGGGGVDTDLALDSELLAVLQGRNVALPWLVGACWQASCALTLLSIFSSPLIVLYSFLSRSTTGGYQEVTSRLPPPARPSPAPRTAPRAQGGCPQSRRRRPSEPGIACYMRGSGCGPAFPSAP
eukprot:749750-Hanusia_phi.AAC.1